MLSEPQVSQRPAQPYAAIRVRVAMPELGTVLPQVHPRVFAWLGERGIAPAGPPFWKYNLVDMDGELEVEVGVPVAARARGDGQVLAGLLPAGRYASLRYTGHPSGLMAATGSLLDWAEKQQLAFDVRPSPEGERWAARLEIYETDPAEEPDQSQWVTQLAFRLAH